MTSDNKNKFNEQMKTLLLIEFKAISIFKRKKV
jgi:hypothetical protein